LKIFSNEVSAFVEESQPWTAQEMRCGWCAVIKRMTCDKTPVWSFFFGPYVVRGVAKNPRIRSVFSASSHTIAIIAPVFGGFDHQNILAAKTVQEEWKGR